jgi:hypothetical protein
MAAFMGFAFCINVISLTLSRGQCDHRRSASRGPECFRTRLWRRRLEPIARDGIKAPGGSPMPKLQAYSRPAHPVPVNQRSMSPLWRRNEGRVHFQTCICGGGILEFCLRLWSAAFDCAESEDLQRRLRSGARTISRRSEVCGVGTNPIPGSTSARR